MELDRSEGSRRRLRGARENSAVGSRPAVGLVMAIGAMGGFGTLALETLWIRQLAVKAGSTVVAAALVVGVFFLAAAAGNLWGAARAPSTRRTLAAYGLLEMASALLGFVLFVIARAWHPTGQWAGEGDLLLASVWVAPPAFFTGASFPMMSQFFVRSSGRRIADGGLLYGANLAGAALGVLGGAVLLPWSFGVNGALAVSAGAQAVGGLLAWVVAGKGSEPGKAVSAGAFPVGMGVPFAVAGFLSLCAQALLLAWGKQVLHGSVYLTAGVLATFLFGLGGGAFAASAMRRKGIPPAAALAGVALVCAVLWMFLPFAGRLLAERPPPFLGDSPPEMLFRSVGLSLAALGPLTLCLGAVFPLTWELAAGGAGPQGAALGGILAANKLGAAIGMGTGAFILLPMLGLPHGSRLLAAGYALFALAVAGMFFPAAEKRRRWAILAALSLVLGAMAFLLKREPAMGLEKKEREVATRQSAYGPVTVVENSLSGSRSILLNTRQRLNGTGRALSSQRHQAWIPMLFAPPKPRVVSLGMASGITSAAVLDFPVRELTAIELVPEVAAVAREYFGPWNSRLFSDSRARVKIGDGRTVLKSLPEAPDLVLCDLLFPEEEGSANLYSRDFLREVRERLSPEGVFCLWLPAYQLEDRTAGSILRAFAEVFPHAVLVRANFDPLQPVIGLVGSKRRIPFGRAFLDGRLAEPSFRALAGRSPFFRSADHAWLSLAGDLGSLGGRLASYEATSDDRPVVCWLGPAHPGDRRLVGMTFSKWLASLSSGPELPSMDLGGTSPREPLASLRAAAYYFVAAVADSSIEGDRRTEPERFSQTLRWFTRAREAGPRTPLEPADVLP